MTATGTFFRASQQYKVSSIFHIQVVDMAMKQAAKIRFGGKLSGEYSVARIVLSLLFALGLFLSISPQGRAIARTTRQKGEHLVLEGAFASRWRAGYNKKGSFLWLIGSQLFSVTI